MNFIKLTSTIHKDPENRSVLVNPWEISTICPSNKGGSTIVTRQGFTYTIEESVDQVQDTIWNLKEELKWQKNKE